MISNDEISELLRCVSKCASDICDVENCKKKKHKGLCLMIMTAIATYRDWEKDVRK